MAFNLVRGRKTTPGRLRRKGKRTGISWKQENTRPLGTHEVTSHVSQTTTPSFHISRLSSTWRRWPAECTGPGPPNVTIYTRKAQPPQVLRPKVKGSFLQGTLDQRGLDSGPGLVED